MIISNKYEVLSEIGRGGMGIVYKVRHTSLETVWALKILPAHLAEDHELVGRFHREARVMARLRHPNIVRVIDVDKSGDLHYFVMEYIDGRSLGAPLAEGIGRSYRDVLDLTIQVTRALAYAHSQKPAVIHRDIKPSNILLETETSRAVVTDFGLAKLAGGADSIRTESGKFIGTLRYCAPEQLTGQREVDGRLDVYAIGMVAYELYSGRSAYVDLERPHIIAGLLQMTVEHPFRWEREVPDDFRRLILRATAKDRDRRYGSVAAMLEDLERLLAAAPRDTDDPAATLHPGGYSSAEPFVATPHRSRLWAMAIGTLAVSLAAGGGLVLRDRLTRSSDRGMVDTGAGGTAPSIGGGAAAAKRPENVQRSVSVLDFSAGSPDPQISWMRDAIRDNLNSRLSSSPECKVFSKEFIDFKAQQMVREGQHQDVKAATMEVAEKLGVTKAVLGSFRAENGTLHIEAHIVDMETGVQEASEMVEGGQDEFADLQRSLARKLMVRLGVSLPPDDDVVRSAGSSDDLENYRLLLQAEGQTAAEPTPISTPPPKDARGKDRRGMLDPRSLMDALTTTAYAVETDEANPSEETEIRDILERYRVACERKDLEMLRSVYDNLTPAQIEANRRYFENARSLAVSFGDIDIALGRNEAAVSYTRKDQFIDNETERPTKVEIRLTKILVRVDGAWKILSGKRAK